MNRLTMPIAKVLSISACMMLAYTGMASAQEDTVGALVDVGTFAVNVPDLDDWNATVDKAKGVVEFSRTKQEVLSLFVPAGGMISMVVFKNRPSGGTPALWVMTEHEMATHFRTGELLGVVATAPKGAKLLSATMDSAIVADKKTYRLVYAVGLGNTVSTSMLHVYFPPEFPRTKEFFGFLINETSVKSMFTSEDLAQITPLIRSLHAVGSTSTLPGVEGDLLRASASGDSAKAKHLVESGANVNALPRDGRGPLALAVLYGHESLVRYFVDHGATVNPENIQEIYHPLASAILAREVRIATYLLERGAKPNVIADGYWSPLPRAIAMHLDTGFVAALLARGADPNLQLVWTPLMHAANEGLAPIVSQLIDHGANVNLADKNGETALTVALGNNQPEVAGLLLAGGANPNAATKDGTSPLMLAAACSDTTSLVRLIEQDANVDAVNDVGSSPLSVAAWNGQTDCARILLNHGATVDHRDKDGFTPLYTAIYRGQVDCAHVLLERGADINARSARGWTPLMSAANRGDSVAVDLLISRGAKLDIENEKGDTALDLADDKDFDTIVALLETAGARD